LRATARQATRQGAHALRLQLENLQAGLKKLAEGLHELEQNVAGTSSGRTGSAGKSSVPSQATTTRRTLRRTIRRRQETKTSRPARRKSQSKKAA
jgi:hypothetical protein